MLRNIKLLSMPNWIQPQQWSMCQHLHPFKLPPLLRKYVHNMQLKLCPQLRIMRSSLCLDL